MCGCFLDAREYCSEIIFSFHNLNNRIHLLANTSNLDAFISSLGGPTKNLWNGKILLANSNILIGNDDKFTWQMQQRWLIKISRPLFHRVNPKLDKKTVTDALTVEQTNTTASTFDARRIKFGLFRVSVCICN